MAEPIGCLMKEMTVEWQQNHLSDKNRLLRDQQ
jgi:hypothetical protein